MPRKDPPEADLTAPASFRRVVPRKPVDSAAAPAAAEADDLKALAASIKTCTACDLCLYATQAVPGEGPAKARLMFIGEQPGDEEDLAGRPFVGPAGRVFDAALERLEIEREKVFVSNAVKHFKFEPRGKRRIHKTPNASEVEACKWWLTRELALVEAPLKYVLGVVAGVLATGSYLFYLRETLFPKGDK